MNTHIYLICVLICFDVSNTNGNSLVDYYENLITTEIANAASYKLPVDNGEMYPNSLTHKIIDFGRFDFIVVGAGSAGAIVARKLTHGLKRVLLLEAGGPESNFTDIPSVNRHLHFSKYNWGYYTESQKYACLGMRQNKCAFPRGKSLGGSSTINSMIYARGNKIDQDLWNVTGWSWDDVLPYYKKLEDYSRIYGDPGYHGYEGPVPIDYNRPSNLSVNYFLNANSEAYRVSKDYNGAVYMAAGMDQYNKINGRRASTNKCYLKDANQFLKIETNAYVYKILIDDKLKAYGVEFTKGNARYRATTIAEVIISGGTINTPQLLMLSGIGPRKELVKHGIPLKIDLPVGQNLQDHIGYLGLQFKSTLKLFDASRLLKLDVWDYLSGTGALTSVAIQALSFINTDKSITSYPDVENFLVTSGELKAIAGNEFNVNEDVLTTFALTPAESEYSFRITVMLLHPKSRGAVTLKSGNPRDFPIVDPNYFSDPDDIETMYKALEHISKLLDTKAFKEIGVTLMKRVLPACKSFEYLSKPYWYCMLRHLSNSIYHPIGTCKMGSSVISSVVDSRLRVHGTKGLRIVDLSVAPTENSGHTNAVAMMIGEKAADIIKQDYAR